MNFKILRGRQTHWKQSLEKPGVEMHKKVRIVHVSISLASTLNDHQIRISSLNPNLDRSHWKRNTYPTNASSNIHICIYERRRDPPDLKLGSLGHSGQTRHTGSENCTAEETGSNFLAAALAPSTYWCIAVREIRGTLLLIHTSSSSSSSSSSSCFASSSTKLCKFAKALQTLEWHELRT